MIFTFVTMKIKLYRFINNLALFNPTAIKSLSQLIVVSNSVVIVRPLVHSCCPQRRANVMLDTI